MWQWNLEERRKFPRYEVTLFSKNFDANLQKQSEAHTKDISAQGMGLFMTRELSVGTPLDICLYMPDNGGQIQIRGTVVWSRLVEPCNYRIGIKLEKDELKPIPIVLRTITQQIKTRYYYF